LNCTNRFAPCRRLALLLLLLITATTVSFSQDVLTYHDNNARTGLNSHETTLTPANVNYNTFGKLFTLTVNGPVDAQPLYLSAVPVDGVTHNLLIVATELDTVYAFDADTGTLLWHVTTLGRGETPSDDRNCSFISPNIGITATPAIARPAGTNGVIYVVPMSMDSSGNYYQRLHALDATSGKELYNGPVTITATYPGTGDGSSGGHVTFDPAQYTERSALLLTDGVLYLTWTSHCDIRPYTGWIMGYNPLTLAQETVLNITPNGSQGAFWGAGAGPASDGLGNLFLLDANGTFDTTLNSEGFPDQGDYGNAFLCLSTKGGLAVYDYFEMYNGQTESDDDVDLGSGGAIVIPDQKDANGKSWQLAAGAGKDGSIYIVDRTDMGKFNPNGNKIHQEISGSLGSGVFSTPAYFNKRIYFGPINQPIMSFQFKNAKLKMQPVSQTANKFPYPGATPSISANEGMDGIVWAADNTDPAILYAYEAAGLTELYDTNQAPKGRDHFGSGNKFIAPLVINGKVYVGTTTGVGVFGLLSPKSPSGK
jgi:outer membrane protein assembly factor BamB